MDKEIILITGGSSGIGKAIAKHLQGNKYTVYGTSRSPEKLDDNYSFTLLKMDVTKEESIHDAVSEILKKEGKIDILINNAGLGMTSPVETTTSEEMERVFSTNIKGMVNVCKEVLPHMRNRKYGRIINITSIGGLVSLPYRGMYCSSKFAVEALTESLSMEVKNFGIQVSIIEPGDFKTNINTNKIINKEVQESDYAEQFQALSSLINANVTHGRDPIIIARKVERILNSKNQRLRYKVATPLEKSSVWLKNILPGRWFESLMMKHFKM